MKGDTKRNQTDDVYIAINIFDSIPRGEMLNIFTRGQIGYWCLIFLADGRKSSLILIMYFQMKKRVINLVW